VHSSRPTLQLYLLLIVRSKVITEVKMSIVAFDVVKLCILMAISVSGKYNTSSFRVTKDADEKQAENLQPSHHVSMVICFE
jgi:hypothetical protein